MNVKRFTGRTSRDALNLVRQAFGEDAVVLSTKPCAEGVEVLAMAPDSIQHIERVAATAPTVRAPKAAAAAPAARAQAAAKPAARTAPAKPAAEAAVERDVEQLAMSTLSFQDYVRERMLKRRQAELREEPTLDEPGFPDSVFGADAAFAAEPQRRAVAIERHALRLQPRDRRGRRTRQRPGG